MKGVPSLADRLPPDCSARLTLAARRRFEDGVTLEEAGRRLAALYMFGYVCEIHLGAAYFRCLGMHPLVEITREVRALRLAQARGLQAATVRGDYHPHPVVGWALLLHSQRRLAGGVSPSHLGRLNEAVRRAATIYDHWRPELRYKTTDVSAAQLGQARGAAEWFDQNGARL